MNNDNKDILHSIAAGVFIAFIIIAAAFIGLVIYYLFNPVV